MPRVFTSKITKEELAERIWSIGLTKVDKKFSDEIFHSTDFIAQIYKFPLDLQLNCLTPQISLDLNKVKFDSENIECNPNETFGDSHTITGFQTLKNGLTYLGVTSGGDWETPLFFIIYWDGKKLRGYIPLEGNCWNTDTREAFGNDEDKDARNIKRRFKGQDDPQDVDDMDFDPPLIINEILEHIEFKK